MRKGITDMEIAIITGLLMALVVLVILYAIADNQLFDSKREVDIERGKLYTAPCGEGERAISGDNELSDIEWISLSS